MWLASWFYYGLCPMRRKFFGYYQIRASWKYPKKPTPSFILNCSSKPRRKQYQLQMQGNQGLNVQVHHMERVRLRVAQLKSDATKCGRGGLGWHVHHHSWSICEVARGARASPKVFSVCARKI